MVRTRRAPTPPRPAFCVCGDTHRSNRAIVCTSGRDDCPGQGLFHIECVGVSEVRWKESTPWSCPECSRREVVPEELPALEVSVDDSPPALEEHDSSDVEDVTDYAVEAVLRHGYEGGRLKFEVSWVGYKDTSWLWEDDLTYCYDLVKPYCDRRRIKTSLKPIGGASRLKSVSNLNLDNWVGLPDLVSKLSYWRSHPCYTSDLPLITLEAASQPAINLKSGLYLILFRGHFYVIILDAQAQVSYACDGTNSVLEDPEDRRFHISSYWPVRIVPLRFNQITRVDHCGASAICIALEMIRLYRGRRLDCGTVVVPASRLKFLTSLLHKEPSESASGWVPVRPKAKWGCGQCSFAGKSRKALLMHERAHV